MPLWIPCAALLASAAVIAAQVGEAAARELATIDPRRAALELGPELGEVDARWSEWVAARLARVAPFSAFDREGPRAVEAALAELPFVAEVAPARVVWPDGLELAVRLRRPVACIRVGPGFLAVADDGTVLPGAFPAPPWVHHGYLPVLCPNEARNARLVPGDRLHEAHHLDGLSVALSMRSGLDADVFDVLGPPLIDARNAQDATVEQPGVRIELEGSRRVLFGRAPWSDAPGELPAAHKWRSLSKAARELRDGGRDWDLVDVRWDVPLIRWREPLED